MQAVQFMNRLKEFHALLIFLPKDLGFTPLDKNTESFL
jgi:hypothetical protein